MNICLQSCMHIAQQVMLSASHSCRSSTIQWHTFLSFIHNPVAHILVVHPQSSGTHSCRSSTIQWHTFLSFIHNPVVHILVVHPLSSGTYVSNVNFMYIIIIQLSCFFLLLSKRSCLQLSSNLHNSSFLLSRLLHPYSTSCSFTRVRTIV